MTIRVKKVSIWVGLYAYWAVLLIWQNIRSVGNRSGADMIIKAMLIALILFSFLKCSRTIHVKNTILIFALTVATLPPLISDEAMGMSEIIYYLYPPLLCFCVYGIGHRISINKKEMIMFFNVIIATVWYVVIYALIFCTDQFMSAFSISSAYGNELSSFLISSHEYGMYLTFGIVFAVICLELNRPKGFIKLFYVSTIIVFAVNLILTFSRTSILAFAVILTTYMLFARKSKYKRFFIVSLILLLAVYLFSDTIRTFVDDIVFKGNSSSGRDELLNVGLKLYSESSLFEQIFGMPYSKYLSTVEVATAHASLHNAYIQSLVTNGAVGLLFILTILMTSLSTCIRTFKKSREYKNLAVFFVGLVFGSMSFMLTNTGVLFGSLIDSYFLTVCAIIVPKYVCNAIQNGIFDDPSNVMMKVSKGVLTP